MPILTDHETVTLRCPCGNTLPVVIRDDSPFTNDEQECGALDDAGWVRTDEGDWCPDCPPAFSYFEEVNALADYQRERDRL